MEVETEVALRRSSSPNHPFTCALAGAQATHQRAHDNAHGFEAAEPLPGDDSIECGSEAQLRRTNEVRAHHGRLSQHRQRGSAGAQSRSA